MLAGKKTVNKVAEQAMQENKELANAPVAESKEALLRSSNTLTSNHR